MLEVGTMGKCKDVSGFDKGLIVMDRQMDHSIAKMAVLVNVPSIHWLVPITSNPRKNNQSLATESWMTKAH